MLIPGPPMDMVDIIIQAPEKLTGLFPFISTVNNMNQELQKAIDEDLAEIHDIEQRAPVRSYRWFLWTNEAKPVVSPGVIADSPVLVSG